MDPFLISVSMVMLGVALIITAVGFYRLVYFVSIGYAFSITSMVVLSLTIFRENLTLFPVLQAALMLVWGLRLGVFLVRRESNKGYRSVLDATDGQYDTSLSKKFLIWIGVSLLYFSMFSPLLFHLAAPVTHSRPSLVLQIAGVLVMAGGLLVESIADWQKAEFKKVNPKGFCNTGLYSWVRYPNYLGEIMVWVGSFLVALPYLNSLVKIAVGLVGLVCIILIMMGSTKRLEISQDERYGKQESYWQFKQTVPVLFPLIPVYSLKDIRVYIE